jgi:hypothetical protein
MQAISLTANSVQLFIPAKVKPPLIKILLDIGRIMKIDQRITARRIAKL